MPLTLPSNSFNKIETLEQFILNTQTVLREVVENHVSVILVLKFNRSDRIQAILHKEYAEKCHHDLSEKIKTCLREKDQFVFVSENECWFLLPQLSSEALAVLAVHRILNALSKPLHVKSGDGKNPVFFHPNVGISYSTMPHRDAENLIYIASEAQKFAALNHQQFSIAQHHLDRKIASLEMLKLLQIELDDNNLEVLYQPKIELQHAEPLVVEALVRWPKAHSQSVDTCLLIDMAEEFGLIEQLTMQVINKVMADMSQWKKEGIQPLVWINLSARLFGLSHLPQLLMRSLDIWNISPKSVGFEITENAFIQDIDNTTALLFQLKNCGFSLSIDDFGTGYSSMAYLRKFPIDEIKIDKMFVQGMSVSIQDKQIVQSIISLGHNFGLKVVAEGVEDEITLDMLEQMECDCIQGYLFSYPISSKEIGAWFKNNPWKQHYQSKSSLN